MEWLVPKQIVNVWYIKFCYKISNFVAESLSATFASGNEEIKLFAKSASSSSARH
jgi:hypothetical protein